MRERICANDCLVRLHGESGEVAHQATRGGELFRLDADVVRFKLTRSGAQRHHHLFE